MVHHNHLKVRKGVMYSQLGEETLVHGNRATLERVLYPLIRTYWQNFLIRGIIIFDVVWVMALMVSKTKGVPIISVDTQ